MYKNQKVRKKIGDIRLYSNKITTKKENETKKIRKFQLFRNKTMDERDVDNYFKKLEKSYPIKGKLNELFDKKILESITAASENIGKMVVSLQSEMIESQARQDVQNEQKVYTKVSQNNFHV